MKIGEMRAELCGLTAPARKTLANDRRAPGSPKTRVAYTEKWGAVLVAPEPPDTCVCRVLVSPMSRVLCRGVRPGVGGWGAERPRGRIQVGRHMWHHCSARGGVRP